jgi:hypothetical protein
MREAIRLTEMRGVGHDPRAAEQLRQAKMQLQDAETWVQRNGDRADSLISRARADIDLAVAFEDEARARGEERRVFRQLEMGGMGVVP